MEIRPSTGGGERRRACLSVLFATTALTAAGLVFPLAGQALADDWTGAVSSSWLIPGNWADGTVPTAADEVRFDNASPTHYTVLGPPGAISGDVQLGDSGSGNLQIVSGGTLTSANVNIGNTATADGTAYVIGSGSRWTGNVFTVGQAGSGSLAVSDGGSVNDLWGYIANDPNSHGFARVIGADSTWTNTYGLSVGVSGTGHLEIANGGLVTASTDSYLGRFANSSGRARVINPDSTWTVGGNLFVGDGGHGTLAIEDGGAVSDVSGIIGKENGTVGEEGFGGSATVTGPDSTWTNTGALFVGNLGSGRLRIENGGTVSNTFGYIGAGEGATGTATVTGAGSSWTNSSTLFVGDDGQGSLTVENHGSVDSVYGVIGGRAAGTATVTGAGSWSISHELVVGSEGVGTLTVEDGGIVTSSHGYLGDEAGATGTATVTGAHSTWTNAYGLLVGDGGNGVLTVEDGGTVISKYGRIGSEADAAGAAKVTGIGSNWTISNEMYVGQMGEGTLIIAGGGKVANTDSYIGYEADSAGEVTVTGPGSTWANNGTVSAGVYGNGTLTVADGGVVAGTYGFLGTVAGSNGTATVTGANSKWTISNYLSIGHAGTGTLNITAGGTVEDTDGIIGNTAESAGSTVTVSGADSVWKNSADLTVGQLGSGAMTIEAGGAVTDTSAYLGREAGSQGTATVTGETSTWANSGVLNVGYSGVGSLTVEDHGKVTDTEGYVGRLSGARGTATVSGERTVWANSGQLMVGYSGVGTLIVKDHGTVTDTRGYIGSRLSSTPSSVIVTGDGSIWTNSEYLSVGDRGAGSLTIANGGQVTSAGAYLGRFAGGEGAVTVAGAGSRWNTSASVLVGDEGHGELTVADGGAAGSAGLYIASQAGSEGIVNIGAAAGDAPQAPGTLERRVRFGDGDGSLVFNHSATNYLFSPEIVGSGRIDLLAGTTELNDAGGFSGSASVNEGATLIVNNRLGGTLDVLSGGRLKGSGMVGTANIAGTIAPGNSIGTLHVAGPYTQAAGSFYEVEVDSAGNADLIDVTGTATLNGGTVKVIPFPDFALATPYTILTATGGVSGTFDGVSGGFSSAFLSPELTYHTNDVTFAVAQTASFASAALTPNQRAAAEGADSTGLGNPVWNAVAMLPSAAEAPAAFDALSGEVHASAKSMLSEDSRFVREAIDARLRAAFAGIGAKAAPVVTYGEDGPKTARADTDRFAVWGHAFGSWGKWDSDGNAAALTRDIGGFVFGGDAAIGETWRLGLMAGYSHNSFDINNRSSSGSADSYHLGAYAGTQIGQFGLRFGGTYSWHDIETARGVAFPGFSDSLSADYDAATAQIFGEAGYRIDMGAASFEPFANLAYVNLHTDGFTENGGAAALTAASASEDTTFTTLGLRAETELPLGGMAAKIHGMLGWRHAFGDTVPTANLGFAGGNVFSAAGVPIAKDAAVIEAGLDVALSAHANLGIAYNGVVGDGMQDHGLKARLGITF